MKKILFIAFIVFIVFGLFRHVRLETLEQPPLIDRVAPAFQLPRLTQPDKSMTLDDLKGHITVLHVFAAWCSICRTEQPFLRILGQQQSIYFYGYDFMDTHQNALMWLRAVGNPYAIIAYDATGMTAKTWGIVGAPETFILDPNGMIRYQWIGPLTPSVWKNQLYPVIVKLMNYENH